MLVIGGPGVGDALRERGLVPVESVDDGAVALMQGYGPDVDWRQLAEGSLAIGRGLLWVATNLDRTIPSPRGRVLGNGSMVAALRMPRRRAAGGRQARAAADARVVERSAAVRPLVVGDRLDTDIEGANRSGIPSLLVLTGVTDWQDLLDAAPRVIAPPTSAMTCERSSCRHLRSRCGGAPASSRAGAAVWRCGSPRGTLVMVLWRKSAPKLRGRGQWSLPRLRGRGTQDARGAGGTCSPRGSGGDATPSALGATAGHGDLWWLPEGLRDTGRRAGNAEDADDLDLVRAVVAAAWAIADAGLTIIGPAQVHAATG